MPIDPRVPLGAVAQMPGVQVESPMQLMSQVYQLQNMQQQQQYNRERILIQQQEEARAQAKATQEEKERVETEEFHRTFGPVTREQREAVLTKMPPELQFRARARLATYDKLMGDADQALAQGAEGRARAQAAAQAAIGQVAQGIDEFRNPDGTINVDAAKFGFGVVAERYPELVTAEWNWVQEDLENRLEPYVHSRIAAGTPEQEGVVRSPEQAIESRISGRTIRAAEKPEVKTSPLQNKTVFVASPSGRQTLNGERGDWTEVSYDPTPGSGKFYLRQGDQLQDVSTQVRAAPPTDPTLTALRLDQLERAKAQFSPQQITLFNNISGQYDRSPLVRAADRTIVLNDAIKEARANPSDPAAQMKLAYAYIQGLDTYQSAVREGELQNMGMLATRWQNLLTEVNRIVTTGAFMPPAVAKQIADSSEQLVGTIAAGAQRKRQEFGARAKVSGVGELWDQMISLYPPLPGEKPGGGGGHKVGDEVIVSGQRIKITEVLPNGKFKGTPVQ